MNDADAATVVKLLAQILSRLDAIEGRLADQAARQAADLLPVYGAVPVPKKKR